MLLLALLPIVLRLGMLAQAPAPLPRTPDDFSFLLLGDTLAHLRLANPPHPMSRFFETNFVLQQPTHSSIYPLGQGIVLAFGQLVFHRPWAGVLLAAGIFSGLCYWMLRAWVSPLWALAGGILTVFLFGPLQYWMNTYWGGSLQAAGGCLIFGALPRLRDRAGRRDAVLLGVGLSVEWLTRPYETLLVAAGVVLYLLAGFRKNWRALPRVAGITAAVVLPAVALTLLQNRQVTGSWTTLPYRLSQYQYGVPAGFTFQPNPVPHRTLTPEQRTLYELQSAVHADAGTYLSRLGRRVRFGRFFFSAPLLAALPFFVLALRQSRYRWVVLWLAILVLGANFYPYFYPHYIAAGTCLFVLMAVTALHRLAALSREAARLIFLLCAAQFVFWYGLHLAAGWEPALELTERYESWDYVNHDDPEGRVAIDRMLAKAPGKQLVFIRYWPQHGLSQWTANAADIDRSQVVRALDLGPAENRELQRYYPDRTAWLLEPDAKPPRLTAYQAQITPPPSEAPKNPSPFEEVP